MSSKKHVAIYARVSTRNQEDNYSLSGQIEDCRKYAKEKGYEVIAEFKEVHTGADLFRPELDKLREIKHEIDGIIVYELDRLSRDSVHLYIIEQEFENSDSPVEYVVGYEDTPLGQLFKTIQAAIKQYEREIITVRMETGKIRRAKDGKVHVGRVAPYGYSYDKDTGQLVILEEEARIVRLIFQWYVYGDETGKKLGTLAISSKLSRMKIPTRNDKTGHNKKKNKGIWGTTSVNRIIDNETYTGIWYWNRTSRAKNSNGKNTRIQNNPDEWIKVDVPVIIKRELWELAQQQKNKNKIHSKRNTKKQYLMQGHLVCSDCGHSFFCEGDYRNHKKGLKYYRCKGQWGYYSNDGETVTCNRSLKIENIDEPIWQHITALLKNPDAILKAVKEKQQEIEADVSDISSYIATLEKKISNLKKQEQKLLDLYLQENSSLSQEVLQQKMSTIRNEKERFEQEKIELETRIQEVAITEQDAEQIKAFCEMAAAGIDRFTFEDKRMVLDILNIKAMVYRGETVEQDRIVISGYLPQVEIDSTFSESGDTDRIDTTISLWSEIKPVFSIPFTFTLNHNNSSYQHKVSILHS